MLLKTSDRPLTDQIATSLSHAPAAPIPALDLYNQRFFNNTITKIEESSRR